MKQHHYQAKIEWTGNLGSGTSGYRDYERSHRVMVNGKPVIEASSDPAFRGDQDKYNPEELFVVSVSSCHMLWVLHLCTTEGIIVEKYIDEPEGIMVEEENGSGRFKEVTLNICITVSEERMGTKLDSIHHRANTMCFIANSVNFPVKHNVRFQVGKHSP